MIPFETLGQFRAIKDQVRKQTGNDELYYRILQGLGYAKASKIPSIKIAHAILAVIHDELYRLEEASSIKEFGGG